MKISVIAVSLFRTALRSSYQFPRFSTNVVNEFGKFDPNHHQSLQEAYAETMLWWRHESESGVRCKVCWNKQVNCLCNYLNDSRRELEALSSSSRSLSTNPDISIQMYYHPKEIGRCCNTGHILQALIPDTNTLVYGNVTEENALVNTIYQEHIDNNPVTCIMFPAKEAVPLSEWMVNRPSNATKVNLVALDGTYNTAVHLLKYLKNRCQLLGIKLPVVKLDLDGGVSSAIGDIKPQPAGNKICTYEAVVRAMQQLGTSAEYCDHLLQDLIHWKQHIINRKIKHPKLK